MSDAIVRTSREVLRAHARTFSLAAAFLPAGRRDEAAVLYALCRHIDDLADEQGDRRALEALRGELEGARSPSPLVAAWLDIAPDPGPVLHLVDGVVSDLGRVRMADDAELLRYCYRVAGTVGLLMCGVIGVSDRAAWPHAVDLGIGMQLTNICRDVLEDAGRGRVYLPEARLQAVGVEPEDLLQGTADAAAVARVVLDLLDLADRYYRSADEGMGYIPARTRFAIRVAARTYRAIGDVLRARGGDTLRGRAVVPAHRKALHVLLAAFGSSSGAPHDAALHRALGGFPGVHGEAG